MDDLLIQFSSGMFQERKNKISDAYKTEPLHYNHNFNLKI